MTTLNSRDIAVRTLSRPLLRTLSRALSHTLSHTLPRALSPALSRALLYAGLVFLTSSCRGAARGAGATEGPRVARDSVYDAARHLGPLFHDVQMASVFPDSKTFVDSRPMRPPQEIAERYALARSAAGFSLATFVQQNFEPPKAVGVDAPPDSSRTMEEHVRALWPTLTRAADVPDPRSSLIPLPHPYVVPGGRFREVYYWDSYFTMLGLVESGRTDIVRNMLDNFAQLINTVGHIPNGNRSYYLGRSQPPFFAAMVGLYAQATDSSQALRYLPAMEREHAFWMEGADRLAPGAAHRRVVRLGDGGLLNRYWDDLPEPRPESYREDYELAQKLPQARRENFYRHVRAAAESGWDFSSRWMRDPSSLLTLETTDLAPVDLNSLLYHQERTIAALRAFRRKGAPNAGRDAEEMSGMTPQADDAAVGARFLASADARRRTLLAHAYDTGAGFFFDVRGRSGERVTDRPTMAAAAPLYFGLATPEQGRAVAAVLERDFLRPGGFVTTRIASGQQWDAPNGWPPLQWMGMEGVRRYGRADLADQARDRWLAVNRRVYQAARKMTEKYDVVDLNRPAGGGEYPTQDGFGWTNGVALRLAAQAAARGAPPLRQP